MTTTCSCGAETAAGRSLCARCTKTLTHAVVNVVHHFADLDNVATKRTRYGNGAATKGSIGKTQPLPVDLRFVDAGEPPEGEPPRPATLAPGHLLRRDVETAISHWCQMAGGPGGLGVAASARVIAHHLRWIPGQDWAPQMLEQMLGLERRLARMIDRPADRWYAGKCSAQLYDETGEETGQCDFDLYARADSGTIYCPRCKTRHDVTERRDILLTEAKEIWVTATEAASALIAWTDYDGSEKKLVDRIYRWRDRDQLEVRDVTTLNGKDRHLYRLGDIQDLLVGDAQNAQTRRIQLT